ncbi:keratin, type I cytoskeletal 50 kDa-like [Xiphias gladius]|uniref:keratin, type I cytoskeletal 50 kDa-like n=1 Tax=Xiphias gladius TaxID=8245 RepID=UPI001A99154D|nr:keratin, type I cytoskeletal 50 kDa-like [Xiphias gladius]
MQFVGGGQTRISTVGPFRGRAPSVYGGAGGYGTRISQSQSAFSYGSGTLVPYSESAVHSNEKLTMQNLNDRLASYLEKVHSLDAANRKLELQIREFYENKTVAVAKDFTGYLAIMADLQAKIVRRCSENQSVILQIDNAHLAAEDFKMKYQTELNMRSMVESDVFRLRGVRDSLTLSISELEMQIEGLREELAYIKSNHAEEVRLLRIQEIGNVNITMDATDSVDLKKVLQETREQYEALVIKNKLELEKWFQSKVEIFEKDIHIYTTEVNTFTTQLSELKRTYQGLEITRESIFTEIQCLQENLKEVNSRYGAHLSQLQVTINMLEVELQQLRMSIEQQQSEYKLLLDIKMRLEMEIAEYRRLLEGDLYEKKAVIISKVVEQVEEHKPHIERRVKTIVEEIVDGKVVSSKVDTQVEDIQ